jgi:hypothetical protein
MHVAHVHNDHIRPIILNSIDVTYDCLDATTKLIAIDVNVDEHNRNNCDIVHVCVVDQHNASGDINAHERDSCCRDSFQ